MKTIKKKQIPNPKKKFVSVSVDKEVADTFMAYCKKNFINRTALLQSIMIDFLMKDENK